MIKIVINIDFKQLFTISIFFFLFGFPVLLYCLWPRPPLTLQPRFRWLLWCSKLRKKLFFGDISSLFAYFYYWNNIIKFEGSSGFAFWKKSVSFRSFFTSDCYTPSKWRLAKKLRLKTPEIGITWTCQW